ncbi:unnamed protein product [Effrenium voratum]|nr:unnamed protein product [Effrenium voratum]
MPLKLLSLFALGVWAEPGLKARRLSNWQAVEEFHRLQHIATKEIQLVAAGLGTAERRQAAEDAASARLAEVGDANLDQLWSSLRTSQGLVALSTNHLQLTAAITALQKEAPKVSQKNILLQKRSLLQEDLVQVLFQSLGVEKDFYKEQNLELKRLWHLKDNSLLWGIELVSLPELSSVCSLHQQLHVGEYWSKLSRATEHAHVDATALYLADQVDKYLQNVISSLEGTSCDLHEPPDVWRRGVEEISNFRRYTQKSAFVLLELVWAFTSGDDPDVIKGFELSLSNTVRESTRSLQQCLKGSPQEMIPPPPTQELVNSLTLLLHEWEELEEMLSLKVQYQDFSVDKIADFLTKISTDIEHLENEIGEGYLVSVDLDNLKQPYMATRQVTFLYELAVQAMWLSLGDTAVNRTDRFEHIVHHWEDSHTALLQGGVAAASTLLLPATTNFCSLSAMAIAHQDFDSFRETFIQLYSAKDTLNLLKDSVVNEASNPSLAEAFAAFKDAWTSFRTTDELRSHDLLIAYHHANPSAFGSKHNLDYAEGPEDYHQVHKVYHKLYRSILQERNYDDIFFLDLDGNCIYSVYKEVDFSTNFAQNGAGLWKDSGLGAAFTAALQAPSQIHVVDWQAYGPSNGELASFIATGIFRGDELLGVFCIRLPPASQPVSLAETEKKMSIAKASMTEAADTYLLTGPTCTKSVPESAWELALQRLTRLSYLTLRLQTEFTLDEYYSQLWLDKAAAGNAAQKASLARTADSQVAQALLAFKNAFQAYRPTDEERLLSLQIKYILTNDNPPGEKAKLDYAEGNEAYHAVHKMYHPTYRALLQSEHYYDIFFFDPDGNCIYSVSKESDFATNFAAQGSGEWKDSGLGDAYRAALQNPTSVNYIDWRPYGPSDGAPASFLSIAVHSSAGDLIGVLATQLPPNLLPRNSSLLLETGIAEVKELLWKFRYGSLSEGIHTPATQPIADALPSEGMWQERGMALWSGSVATRWWPKSPAWSHSSWRGPRRMPQRCPAPRSPWPASSWRCFSASPAKR